MKQLRNIDSIIRKAYEPLSVELISTRAKWDTIRERPEKPIDPYTICLPPPNITGSLHLGHALTVAIEDSLIRWHQKMGYSASWIPGCDHASIATQVAVEKHLLKTQNISRSAIGREQFISHVMEWKSNRESEIKNQLEKMGALLDWQRYRFTMDEGYSRAVTEAFCTLRERDLIYRKQSFVNWCPHLKSTVSDIEVDSINVDGPTEFAIPSHPSGKVSFGRLYTVRYAMDAGKFITVSTTRPETILGDVALAVHPSDNRYSHLVGSFARHPFSPERMLPIIADEGVDPKFGTGVVKVTPAHDELDFEIWQRANMKMDGLIDIFDDAAMIRPGFGKFSGLSRYAARDGVVSALGQMGLLESVVGHKQVLPLCSRSGDVVEPRLRYQWFVACRGRLAERAVKAAETGELTFVPEFYKNVWLNWLTNIKDWCISRQLWWGHRIPAYRLAGEQAAVNGDSRWFVARSVEDAMKAAGVDESARLDQDEDVLDTWFSSGLYPLASLGWPQQTAELASRYPLSVMETGADILFFWVARMVMLCAELAPNQGQLPFKTVLLHGIVRDATGKKMSKSLGNVVDPLDAIQGATLQSLQARYTAASDASLRTAQARLYSKGIPECGADGLRLALCLYDTHATDINIDVGHLAASRRFGNKLWQAVRFVLMHTPPDYKHSVADQVKLDCEATITIGVLQHPMDAWLLTRLEAMKANCHAAFSSTPVSVANNENKGSKPLVLPPLRIHAAALAVRNFVHHDLCDTYIEYVKADLKSDDVVRNKVVYDILYTALVTSFDYLHPFMPFLTDELSRVVRQVAGLPAVDSVLQLPIPKSYQITKHSDWDAAHSSVSEALDCLYSARSAITLTANAINQQKKGERSPTMKPSYSIIVSVSDRLAKRSFSSTFSRLLPAVQLVSDGKHLRDAVLLPLHESQPVCIAMKSSEAKLLMEELERRAAKAKSKISDFSSEDKQDRNVTAIEELHSRWLSALKARFLPRS